MVSPSLDPTAIPPGMIARFSNSFSSLDARDRHYFRNGSHPQFFSFAGRQVYILYYLLHVSVGLCFPFPAFPCPCFGGIVQWHS
jgi:hypothetical protein